MQPEYSNRHRQSVFCLISGLRGPTRYLSAKTLVRVAKGVYASALVYIKPVALQENIGGAFKWVVLVLTFARV